jgi:hypothetical protein
MIGPAVNTMKPKTHGAMKNQNHRASLRSIFPAGKIRNRLARLGTACACAAIPILHFRFLILDF